MRIQPAVLQETKKIALGTGVLSLLMFAVFVLLKQFDYTVILGALLGNVMAVGNFFLLALSVQRAAESMQGVKLPPLPEPGEGEDEKEPPLSPEARSASQKVRIFYGIRLLCIGIISIIAISLPCFHSIAALIPLLFPRLVIMFVHKKTKEA